VVVSCCGTSDPALDYLYYLYFPVNVFYIFNPVTLNTIFGFIFTYIVTRPKFICTKTRSEFMRALKVYLKVFYVMKPYGLISIASISKKLSA
jgi:hypothetical protein